MDLVIFDIDGTLTRSKAADGECYAEAWRDEFGVEGVSVRTEDFRYSTDSGIAREIFLGRFGREGTPEETARLIGRFVELLAERARRSPEDFAEVPGARAALARLRQDENWAVAIATGSWRASADLKLREATLDVEGLPIATSDDLVEREDIITSAVALAEELHDCGGFAKKVYVGDGVWDCRAAARLGFGFVGIHDTRDPAVLREAGASAVLRDCSDIDLFLRNLRDACCPASPG